MSLSVASISCPSLSHRLVERGLLGCDVVVDHGAHVPVYHQHPVAGQWRGDHTQLLVRLGDTLERRRRVRRGVLVGVEVKRAFAVRSLDAVRSELPYRLGSGLGLELGLGFGLGLGLGLGYVRARVRGRAPRAR